jgi:hypothetical protein
VSLLFERSNGGGTLAILRPAIVLGNVSQNFTTATAKFSVRALSLSDASDMLKTGALHMPKALRYFPNKTLICQSSF